MVERSVLTFSGNGSGKLALAVKLFPHCNTQKQTNTRLSSKCSISAIPCRLLEPFFVFSSRIRSCIVQFYDDVVNILGRIDSHVICRNL